MKYLLIVLKTIALWFDWVVYELLTYAYALFAVMCRLNFSSLQAILSTIVVRIQVLFGVVMLFIVAFNLLTLIIDPSNKNLEGGSKLITKIIVSVGLLVAGNFAFGLLDNLQNAILDENVIEKLVIGNNSVESNNQPDDESIAKNQYEIFIGSGRWISYNLFFSFYDNPDPSDAAAEGDATLKPAILNGEKKFYQIVEHASDDIKYEYPIVSTFCGLLAVVMYVTFAIDIGVRAFNIMILRVIMPVAAMGYIIPKKGEEILKKYISTYVSTYAQLFAKIFISYLIVYLMMALMSILITGVGNDVISGDMVIAFNNQNFLASFPIFFKVALLIVIFVSLYLFYINLPKLISKILGVEITSGKGLVAKTLGIVGSIASLTLGTTSGIIGGLGTGIAGGIRGKAGFVGTAKAALHNAGQGFKKNVGNGLTKLGNNTIGEKATSNIGKFANNHNQEARSKRKEANEKQANEYASNSVKERKTAAAEEKAAKQKLREEETLRRARETANSSTNNPVEATTINNPINRNSEQTPMKEGYNTSSAYASVLDDQEHLNAQQQLKNTLKMKYQTRQDDELRNQGGQLDASGTTHAPARDMGAPSVASGSAFGDIDMNAEIKYQEGQQRPQNVNPTPNTNPIPEAEPRIIEDSAAEEQRNERLARGERVSGNDSTLNENRGEGEEQESINYDGRLNAEQIEKNKEHLNEAENTRQYEEFNGDIGE